MRHLVTITIYLAIVLSFTFSLRILTRLPNEDDWTEYRGFDVFDEISGGFMTDKQCETNNSSIYRPPENVTIPKNLDWRNKGYVTEVLNQGECGACWAFVSVASLEAQIKKLSGKLYKLSEQHLVDCSNTTGNNGCKGGQICKAFEYAISAGGIEIEQAYKYKKKIGQCNFLISNLGARVVGYSEIPFGDEDALLKAVALVGPIAAGIDGRSPNFRNYKYGIYNDESCSSTQLSHAVTVIGYGSENNTDYWFVKNSWGPLWGQQGFGKVIRNKKNRCGLASRAFFPVLRKEEFGTPLWNLPM